MWFNNIVQIEEVFFDDDDYDDDNEMIVCVCVREYITQRRIKQTSKEKIDICLHILNG